MQPFERWNALIRKYYSKQLNPFNLCPNSLVFWLYIPPFRAIGISIVGFRGINILWRQQIEPNETIFVAFKILELKLPFPLVLLVMFSAFGLTIADAANQLGEIARKIYENKIKKIEEGINDLSSSLTQVQEEIANDISAEKQETLIRSLDPFKLSPRMSIFFPVYDKHTSIGFLTIDFRHIMFSVKQSIDPSENIQSIIRFADFYSPFPVQIGVMVLSVGLFLTGSIYEYGIKMREEVISEVKELFKLN